MANYQNFYDFPPPATEKGKKHLRYSYEIIMLHTREQPSARQARVYGLLARDFMHHYCVPATFPIKSHSVHWNNNKIYWHCMMRIPNKNLILIGAGSTFTDVVSVRFGNLCRKLSFNTRKFPENVQQVTARPKRPLDAIRKLLEKSKIFSHFRKQWKLKIILSNAKFQSDQILHSVGEMIYSEIIATAAVLN